VQARLLDDSHLSPKEKAVACERLELAAIGTVHSVGHQLLSRFALHLGLSPQIEVLDEASQAGALNDFFHSVDLPEWVEVMELAHRLSIDDPRAVAMELLAAKRTNCISDEDFCRQMDQSVDGLCFVMAPAGLSTSAIGFDDLYREAESALRNLLGITDTTKVTRETIEKLRDLTTRRAHQWRDFARAARLKAGKKSGADDELDRLRGLAAQVLSLAPLHADVRLFSSRLAQLTLALSEAFQTYKEERGLVDFTDLETLLLDLVHTESLHESLEAEIKVAVVDEFQDTNPIQLAIFQKLRSIADANRWVGDAKQAIYGFRGADPELVAGVWEGVREAERETLPKNYRSRAGLVQLVGRLFQPVFGDNAVLEPVRDHLECSIERWLIDGKNKTADATGLAHGLAHLHEEGRPWGDMAVLTRSHTVAAEVAAACHSLDIPALIGVPGLLLSRECALALAALRVVADPFDSLAAATVLHLLDLDRTGTPEWLEQRLTELKRPREGLAKKAPLPFADSEYLNALRTIDRSAHSPSVTLARAVEALHLAELTPGWGGAAQRIQNLDTLGTMAREYEEEQRRIRAGVTLTGMITWFDAQTRQERDMIQPPRGIDAVTISTYHSAKGLEWPFVVLTELDSSHDPDMWSPTVTGGDPGGVDPLSGRTLRYWPWPFARDWFGRLIKGSGLNAAALESSEGKEANRREYDETLRLLYVGFTRARDGLVLAHRAGKCQWLEKLSEVDTLLPTEDPGEWDVDSAEHTMVARPLEGCDATYVLRHIDGSVQQVATPTPGSERWLKASEPLAEPVGDVAPRFSNPSDETPPSRKSETIVIEIPGGLKLAPRAEPDEATRLAVGDAVHAYFAALPSLRNLDTESAVAVAERCITTHGVKSRLGAPVLVQAGQALVDWVDATYPEAQWLTEAPITAPRDSGSQWRGIADLILELPDGGLVLFDHKSNRGSKERCEKKAHQYTGQLAAYREALEEQARVVAMTAIHFPLAGLIVGFGSRGNR